MEQTLYSGPYDEPTKQIGAMQLFDEQLDALSADLERLEVRLGPVLRMDPPDVRVSEVRPEPVSQLHGRSERLSDLRHRLCGIIERVGL